MKFSAGVLAVLVANWTAGDAFTATRTTTHRPLTATTSTSIHTRVWQTSSTVVESPSTESTAAEATSTCTNPMSKTERIMNQIASENQVGGAGGVSTWEAFQRTEANWARLKASEPFDYDPTRWNTDSTAPPPFVTQDAAVGRPQVWETLRAIAANQKKLDYDVVVCGGTLGIFFAAALQKKGHSVCVLEAGKLQGREQEWNISRDELDELVALGILSKSDIEACIRTEFPACRSGFKNKEVTPLTDGYFENNIGFECETDNVLNLGVAPSTLIEKVSANFIQMGGVIRDETRLQGVAISDSIGAAVDLGDDTQPITSRLVLDCMGNGSPISRQQRYGQKPDGICAVVGSCASGFDPETNRIGDIIYTNSKIQDKGEHGQLQYFWEAFPVGIGRNDGPTSSDVKTSYMFTYMDADAKRPTLESLMEDYWEQLPIYQPSIRDPETDLEFRRVLFAFFPTYKDSPLQPAWNRLLAVGDASGIQSPLSFGGFGALTRHLDRISGAVSEALDENLLHKRHLGEINAYTPNLSAAWMFQKAMSVRMGQKVDPDFVNRLLAVNFQVMDQMGKRTIKPFLQDVVRFDGLIGSLARTFVKDPTFTPQIVAHVGIPTLAVWLGHLTMMGTYGFLDTYISQILEPFVEKMKNPQEKFQWKRRMEAWKFGSGNDYELPKEDN